MSVWSLVRTFGTALKKSSASSMVISRTSAIDLPL